MRSTENRKLYSLMFEAVIEIQGQPATPSQAELVTIPSQYMKFTEFQKRFYQVTWDNPNLDEQTVYDTYLKALKRKEKVMFARLIDPAKILTA